VALAWPLDTMHTTSTLILILAVFGASSVEMVEALTIVVAAGVGVLVARQLSEVPENTIKTVVGVMLTSFGVFWVGEGAGVRWPGSDLAILGLVGFFVLVTLAATAWMRSLLPVRSSVPSS
jgi:uncharacterized membrane protein